MLFLIQYSYSEHADAETRHVVNICQLSERNHPILYATTFCHSSRALPPVLLPHLLKVRYCYQMQMLLACPVLFTFIAANLDMLH